MRRVMVRLLGFVVGVFVLASCHANSSVFTIDTTADTVDNNPGDGFCADVSGDCSLRAAVMEANALPGVEEIRLANGATYVLSIAGAGEDLAATGDLDIAEEVVLIGDATIDANGLDRVLDTHHAGGLVEIDGVALTGGSAVDGAAVRTNATGLTSVLRSHITANIGDAVTHNAGTLYLWNSTLNVNTGNAIVADGGTTNLQNTTITANTAAGIAVSGGTAVIKHSTITNNTTGIQVLSGTAAATATIIANQTNSIDCAGTVTSGGSNIESATTCAFTSPDDLQNTDPLLGPLADNGGRVPTLLPATNSDAIDNAGTTDCTLYNTDARDLPRPSGPACDTGAIESQALPGDCTPPDLTPGANLRYCDLSGANLSFIDLSGADLTGADLTGASLILTNVSGATLDAATMDGANLTDADLSNVSGAGTSLRSAVFTRTDLMGADLGTTDLFGVVSTAITTSPAALPVGVIIAANRLVGPGVDLSGADLSNVDLSGAVLTNATLDHAVLTGATISGTNLIDATLTGVRSGSVVGIPAGLPSDFSLDAGWLVGPSADLTSAVLPDRDFSGRDLTAAVFDDAILDRTLFAGADLTSVRMDGTWIGGTDFTTATMWRLSARETFGTPLLPAGWALERRAIWGPGVDLRGYTKVNLTQLADIDISGALLSDIEADLYLLRVTAFGTDFSNYSTNRVGGLTFNDSDLTDSIWSGGRVGYPGMQILGSNMTNADFTDFTFDTGRQSTIIDSVLQGTIFTGANLYRIDGVGISGTPIDLPATHRIEKGLLISSLIAPAFYGVDVSGYDLSGVDIGGQWASTTAVGTDFSLSNVNQIGGDLTGANFQGARLLSLEGTITNADLTNANLLDLASSDLIGTPLQLPHGWQIVDGRLLGPWANPGFGLSFANENLTGVDATGANLQSATFGIAALADLRGADLRNADFTDANLFGTFIDGADLSGATWSNTLCPDGTNSDTNGDNSCVGHGPGDVYELTGDPAGTPYDIAGSTLTMGDEIIKPTLAYVSGATIVEGTGLGVDWYIDGVLFRDDDIFGPFEIGNRPTIPTGVVFNGQGAAGSGNSFYIGPGNHTITAVASTTAGLVTYSATFRVDAT